MKKFLTILVFTAVAFAAVFAIDEMSYWLGITTMFSDVEHYDYWFWTRFTVCMIWLMSSIIVVTRPHYNVPLFRFAMGIVVYVIAALMFTVFILIMVGIIVLPVEGMALGVILIAYMCGIIGMTVLAGNLMKRYMDLLDEIRYDDDLHEFHLDLESEE